MLAERNPPCMKMNFISHKKILVIDDEADILAAIKTLLTGKGAQIFTAADGARGVREFYEQRPDLVIVDIIMPEMDGWQVCTTIRQISDVPIILLSALDAEDDIIRGLNSGAVDYVTKPFNPKIVLARVNAALRQVELIAHEKRPVTYSDSYLTIELQRHRVFVDGEQAKLTATEFGLLAYLVQNAGQTLSSQQILENVWGWEYRNSVEYVHTYISSLRRKLEKTPRRPEYILTEHGIGYRFVRG